MSQTPIPMDRRLLGAVKCALLLRLPALKTVRLPRREQLTHLEALDALPQSVKVQMGLTPYPSAPETFRVPPPPKPKPEPSEKARAIVDELKRRTETPCWKLTLRPEGPQGLLDSKVGGLPYWDPALTLEQIQALELPTHVEADLCTPVIREAALTAEKTVGYMGPGNFPFDALFREAVRAVIGEDIGDKHEYQYFNDADRDYLYDQLSAAGHRLLGYPCFTQCDPRKPDGPYDTLLFQLDSDMTEDREDLVLWGDCGVGNFFINREDLLRRDFSRVLYNWDCS